MDHLVQFTVSVDDDRITSSVEKAAEKAIIKDINARVAERIFSHNTWGPADPSKDRLSAVGEGLVYDFLTEHQDNIIHQAAQLLSDKLARSKAVKEKAAAVAAAPAELEVKIKYFDPEMEELHHIEGGKSDWVDMRSAQDMELKKGEFALIPLGVAMKLPAGYEALLVPRSSMYKNFKVIQTNTPGVIDESFCGPNDQWHLPVIAMEDTTIHKYDRLCQFRLLEHMPALSFVTVDELTGQDRGMQGSTGIQ